jgi:hypothetical protein
MCGHFENSFKLTFLLIAMREIFRRDSGSKMPRRGGLLLCQDDLGGIFATSPLWFVMVR